jgi:hypothetical protein
MSTVFVDVKAAPSIPAIISGQGAAVPLHSIIDEPSKIDSFSTKGAKPVVKGNLEFDNIHFAYPSRPTEKVFEGLSLKINAGDTIALGKFQYPFTFLPYPYQSYWRYLSMLITLHYITCAEK